MTTSSLVVVVDRGRLKAYRVSETPTRGPKLELVQAFGIPNLNAFSRAHRTTAATDWPELEIEETRQICRQLAGEITNLVRRDFGEGWSLAAPESICNQIVDLLPLEIRKRIVERVERDLVKIPVAELLSHFRSLQPV
jgi:Protein required for attachment to host cells